MSKEHNFIIATVSISLALQSCNLLRGPSHAVAAPLDPTRTNLPTPTKTSEPTPTPYQIQTETNDLTESPLALDCILPFSGASMEGGLQFLSPVLNKNGKQDRDGQGRPYRHLGLDFKGNDPLGGDEVSNMCDGTFIFSGYIGSEYQSHRNMKTLGNVVVVKYDYSEGGIKKSLYMVYAHLRNIPTDLKVGDVLLQGEKIGEVSNSGGWKFPHLHINAWTEEAWNYLLKERFHGNTSAMAGFYPDSEYDDGEILRDMVDPKVWIEQRLSQ